MIGKMFGNSEESSNTCEYCGDHRGYMHTCQGSLTAEEEKSERFEREYKGGGKKQGRLVLDYECFDSDQAMQMMFDDISISLSQGRKSGGDDMLGFRWQIK